MGPVDGKPTFWRPYTKEYKQNLRQYVGSLSPIISFRFCFFVFVYLFVCFISFLFNFFLFSFLLSSVHMHSGGDASITLGPTIRTAPPSSFAAGFARRTVDGGQIER